MPAWWGDSLLWNDGRSDGGRTAKDVRNVKYKGPRRGAHREGPELARLPKTVLGVSCAPYDTAAQCPRGLPGSVRGPITGHSVAKSDGVEREALHVPLSPGRAVFVAVGG